MFKEDRICMAMVTAMNLFLAACLAAGVLCVRANAVPHDSGTTTKRQFDFPKRSLGVLRIGAPDRDQGIAIEARGRVRVPNEHRVELIINYDSAHDLSPLKNLPPNAIWKLNLSRIEVPNAQFANIKHLTGLCALNARGTDLTDAGMENLAGLKQLVDLNLGETYITSKGLPYLSGLTNLKCLYIDNTNVGDELLESISQLPNLQNICVARSHVSDKGVKKLVTLPSLHTLDLEYNVSITDTCIPDVKKMKKLRCLKIAHSRVSSRSVKDIVQMKGLEELVYSKRNFTAQDLTVLKKALPKCSIQDYERRRTFQPEMFAPLH